MTRSFLVAVALLLGAGGGRAFAAEETQGFAEVRGAYLFGVTGKQWQLVERARPTLQSDLSDRVRLVGTIEAGFMQGRDAEREAWAALLKSDLGPALQASGAGPREYENALLHVDGAHDYLDVDRLYVDWYGEHFDLRVGRQALNWGSAQFFNPTDPFPEVLLAEPWRPRRGVNAARLNVPVSERVDVSAVAALNDALDEFRGALRARWNVGGTDLALVGAYRGEARNALVGVDLRGTLVVGWWVEAAYLFGVDAHEEVSAGVDYSFPVLERLVVFAEYYRNGAGERDVTQARRDALFGGGKRDAFAPFVLGRDYALLGATLGVLPELSANAAVLQNLNDGSAVVIPTVSYAALDWLEVAASAQLPFNTWGTGGELRPSKEQLQFNDVHLDLSGLVPAATVTVWTRASY